MLGDGGEMSYLGTAGLMGPDSPMREDIILPLASVGKMYTATAAMILIERNRMALDDPVSRFVPAYSNDAELTVRHLLTHTTGLTVDGDDYWEVWNRHAGETSTLAFARELSTLPRTSAPGDRFEYGGTGGAYEVLGAVIESASGQTLDDFMRQNIFQPLEMADSYFFIPDDKAHRLPAFYRRVDGVWVISREMGVEWPRTQYFFGGGGVSASAEDLLVFAQIFINGGEVDGTRILKQESVDQMMSDQLSDENRGDRTYSWGYGASVPIGTSPGNTTRYGWVGGNYNELLIHRPTATVFWVGFPVEPPGDIALLQELRQMVMRGLRARAD